ncbi:hypothetical protein [Vibrio phage pTD1]|uniref:Uncharacterized protein n=1 Tax=Vibrio phage pTD1 TaxID=1938577 RepID=A0A1Q2U2T6_9CAUD|nr:hypothetical protein FDH33_gp061 [Vibrio phage pTD1]BAW98270.1 hypothetical protein [Vibrio phage pTD1]
MFLKKLFYPRSVEGFTVKLEKRLTELAVSDKPGYYDNLFKIVTEEYDDWNNLRIRGKSDKIRLINIGVPLNNRSREVIFFRLPVPVGTKMDLRTQLDKFAYCRGLSEQALTNDDKRRPLNISLADHPVKANQLNHSSVFYSQSAFLLLRRNGAVQRSVDPARLWDCLTPKFDKVK